MKKKSKKVLILSSLNSSDDIRIFKKEAKSLAEKYDVTYICAGDKNETKKNNNINIKILRKPAGILGRIKHLNKIMKMIAENEAEIYHIHNPELLMLVPKIKKRFPNAKIIFDMHEDFEEAIKDKQWLPKGIRSIVSRIYRVYLNKLSRSKLDYTIVTTPLIKARFESFKNIEVIENYAPLIDEVPKIGLTPKDIQDCIDENQDKLKIVFTGLINEQRGVFEVIKAVKRVENTVFIMIGLYSKEFFEKLTEMIEEDKLKNKIYLFPSVEYDQMLASMRQMDIGILPYLPYGNHMVTRPNKLFEYMMTSLPIISSNFPLYEEIVSQGVGVSVNPENIDEIVDAIKTMTSPSEIRGVMGSKGYELYKNKYNWCIEEEKLYKIYEELLGE